MKPVVLIFTRYYLPGYLAGGPIRTIANMVDALSDEFEFKIVALDRDIGDRKPFSGIAQNVWMKCGGALVQYVSAHSFGFRRVAEIARSTPHDVIYLNSFFDLRFTQQILVSHRLGRLSGRPIVLAPRGEFSKGALQLKRLRKQLFLLAASWLKLYDGLTWQGSSEAEVADILRAVPLERRELGRIMASGRVALAQDVAKSVDIAPSLSSQRVRDSVLRVCFLSRICPMKNLDYALRVLRDVRVPVKFFVYGPLEDAEYWSRCQGLIQKLPSNIQVVYEGEVVPEQVVATLSKNDLFLFPTRGENFGHVIHEALCAGLPLLISDQTPWKCLEEQGLGWDLPLSEMSAFSRRIEEIAGWQAAVHRQFALRARAFASQIGKDPETLEANRRMFLDAICRANDSASDRSTNDEVGSV